MIGSGFQVPGSGFGSGFRVRFRVQGFAVRVNVQREALLGRRGPVVPSCFEDFESRWRVATIPSGRLPYAPVEIIRA
jgi:hypothetical protein